MTEDDWQILADPQPMLAFLEERSSDRKLRLFAVACCYRYWEELAHPDLRQCVEAAESAADGKIAPLTLNNVQADVNSLVRDPEWGRKPLALAVQAILKDRSASLMGNVQAVSRRLVEAAQGEDRLRNSYALRAGERFAQADLLRDLFGNPFQTIVLEPRWLTSTVVDLSHAIYDERAFDRMPILADALMDAGCDSDEIIHHCRGIGPHARGCWLVDQLLGQG